MSITELDPSLSPVTGGERARVLQRLQAQGLVDASAIARAQLVAGRTGQPVEQVLNQLGALTDGDLAGAYAGVVGCGLWDPEMEPVEVDLEGLGVAAGGSLSPRMLR